MDPRRFGPHTYPKGNYASAKAIDEFHEMYQGNILEKFRDEAGKVLSDDVRKTIPPLPKYGQLDLDDILSSEYFFS